jgi:hypothetical protein
MKTMDILSASKIKLNVVEVKWFRARRTRKKHNY